MRLRDVSIKEGGHHMFRAASDRKMHNAQCKTRDTERTAQKCNCCQRVMVKKAGRIGLLVAYLWLTFAWTHPVVSP